MLRSFLSGIALTAVALLVGGSLLYAEGARCEKGKASARCEALAAKLNLTDKQKEEFHKIHTEFHTKAAPLKKQLWAMHHEQFQAIKKVLTDEQRAKLPEFMKSEWDKRWQEMSGKLNLTEEQKQKIDKVRAEFREKFQQLATNNSEKSPAKFHELRHEAFKAITAQLTPEQRSKFWSAFREERHHWHNSTAQAKEHNAFAEKLGLSADQKKQIDQVCTEFSKKREEAVKQLKQLRQEEHTAMAKVLTAEQHLKLNELRKEHPKSEKKEGEKK